MSSKNIISLLKEFFASTYTLYLKTQNFHWNITGNRFYELHLLFEKQYKEMQEAIDVIAEHIRTLDTFTSSSFKEFLTLSKIQESLGDIPPNAEAMIKQLANDQDIICNLANELIVATSDDQATQDLIIDRLRVHKANAWMLKSSL